MAVVSILRSQNAMQKNYILNNHSYEYLEVEEKITDRYPLLEFQMWELIQFNEFLNHQIAKNIIVVEVENMLEDSVFDTLRE